MRKTFIATLVELAEKDPRIVLLTADLGYTVLEPFRDTLPDRFFNVGVAEQNMVGMATGLAEAGYIPFVYSIATFASLRPYEFIRNGLNAHQLPVRIVGVGGGYEYGSAGITHHALEDIAVMRVQPNMMIITPADFQQAKTALLKTWDSPSPIYYRVGKSDQNIVQGLDGHFDLGKIQTIGDGKQALVLTSGAISYEVSQAVQQLRTEDIQVTVGVVASIAPIPEVDLINLLSSFDTVFTVEAHYITGGLGSLVAEIIAENALQTCLVRCGVRGSTHGVTGSEQFLLQKSGIDSQGLVKTIKDKLSKN